ncbi:MAG: hypothetical protein SFV15_03940 [Polyangiaceae bacterium]|nr:hypothetical protein [Polyangiaceae bacterium]
MKKVASVVSCGFVFIAGLSLTGACSGEAFEGSLAAGGVGGSLASGGTGGKNSMGGAKATTGGALGSGGQMGSGGVSAIGGAGNGGRPGVGGSQPGGGAPPVNSCNNEADCTACLYPTAPKTHDECYCPTCASTPLSRALCDYNENAFKAQQCDTSMCPLAPCAVPEPVGCDNQKCVFKSSGGVECERSTDCTNCAYATAPQSPNQCTCPGCGTPMPVSRCEDNTKAWEEQGCSNLALPCPAIACIQAGPAICSPDGKCIADPNMAF